MTENQKIKMELLGMFKDVKAAIEAYKFLQKDDGPSQASASAQVDGKQIKDGVYYLTADNKAVPYQAALTAPEDTKGILCVQGERSVVVALKDCNGGEYTTLTIRKDPYKLKGNYIAACLDAMYDWNGEDNTNHLKAVGLPGSLNLKDGQYIPSMGEMLFIFTHKKDINNALEKAGGQPIANSWYWTSTEGSAANAWGLHLDYGPYYTNKSENSLRVRPVSAFIY